MHGPCLSLAGADGIGNAGSGIDVARPATCMQGMRAGHAAPAISPRRFVGRHRAACFARLSAGLRTRGYGRDIVPSTAFAASQGHRPSACANASPPTAAGQCRDGLASEDADRTGFPFHPAACGCRNRRPQHIGPMAIRQSIPKASPATSCRRSSVLRNQSRLSHASIIALRKTGGGHTNEKRAEARFSIQAMTRRLTRPRRPRLRPRPSSTGGCGPACRLPAP